MEIIKNKITQKTKQESRDIDEDKLRDQYTLVSDSVFITDNTPSGTPRGSWAEKGLGEDIFVKNDYDFKGSTGDNCEYNFSHDYNNNMQNCALISFLHTDLPTPSTQSYNIYLTLRTLKDAYAEDDAGSHREWFFDHISGYPTGETITQTQPLTEYPTRDNYYDLDNFDDQNVNYDYDVVKCEPGKAVGFVTRGYEVDNSRVNTDAFENGFKDWVELMWDFAKGVTTKKYKDFIIDITSMLFNALLSNEDDPMTPIGTAFSHEACQFIYENCENKTFRFSRRAQGMETSLEEIDDIETSGWSRGDYVQLLTPKTSRNYTLEYEVRIELA